MTTHKREWRKPNRLNSLKILARGLHFSLASNASVFFVMKYGLFLWPEGLPVNTQNIFWLASGVNTAGLLLLGLRYWPVLLLNAFPAWILFQQPLMFCLIAAMANALEALLAAYVIRKSSQGTANFDQVRHVSALVIVSLIAPLINTLLIPVYLCFQGVFPWSDYLNALGNWNLSNGASLLILTPLIVSVFQRKWQFSKKRSEALAVIACVVVLSLVAFDQVFRNEGINYAFIIFPAIIYTAIRFGAGETSAAMGLVLVNIYITLAAHANELDPSAAARAIWFSQAFCWVLAATGFLVTALALERRQAEQKALKASLEAERSRLAALRYQINPHFLFNALNSARSTLPLSDSLTRNMITQLSEYLRSTLKNREDDFATLDSEITGLRNYLNVENSRFGDRLRVEYHVNPEAGLRKIPVYLFQPLVENAIKHGLEKSPGETWIRVAANLKETALQLRVENSGVWREPQSTYGTGLGLENIKRRLQILYGSKARLGIQSNGKSVQVTIELPR